MTYPEAFEEAAQGKRIARRLWGGGHVKWCSFNRRFFGYPKNLPPLFSSVLYAPTRDDERASDWEVRSAQAGLDLESEVW